MMTSYEKYMAVIQGEAVDCLPRLPILMGNSPQTTGCLLRPIVVALRILTLIK
jgi:hypothetical protein